MGAFNTHQNASHANRVTPRGLLAYQVADPAEPRGN